MAWPSVSRGGRLPVLGTPVPPSLCSALPRPLVSPPASPPPPSHPSIISPPPRFPVSPSCVLLPTIQCPPQPPVPTSPRPPPPSPVPPLPFPPSSILRPHVHPLPPPLPAYFLSPPSPVLKPVPPSVSTRPVADSPATSQEDLGVRRASCRRGDVLVPLRRGSGFLPSPGALLARSPALGVQSSRLRSGARGPRRPPPGDSGAR